MLVKSTDDGVHWHHVATDEGEGYYGQIAIDPRNPDVVLIGETSVDSDGSGTSVIMQSTNGGRSWTSGFGEHIGDIIRALAYNPKNPSIVWSLWDSSGSSANGDDPGYDPPFVQSTDGGRSITEVALVRLPNGPPPFEILFGGGTGQGYGLYVDSGYEPRDGRWVARMYALDPASASHRAFRKDFYTFACTSEAASTAARFNDVYLMRDGYAIVMVDRRSPNHLAVYRVAGPQMSSPLGRPMSRRDKR